MPTDGDTPSTEAPETQPAPAERPLDTNLVQLREDLIKRVVADPATLAEAALEIQQRGTDMFPILVAGLTQAMDPAARKATELKVLLDLASGSESPAVAEAAVSIASSHPEAWIRRYATWSLASFAPFPGADRIVPTLVGRLKYERDDQCLVWTARSLAAYRNFAGLQTLAEFGARPIGNAAGDAARAQLPLIAGQANRPTAADLAEAWNLGRIGRADGEASDGLLGELWLLVADLSGEHFQLRGVDDARHTLSRLGPWAAHQFALALEDEDEYVRLHVTQVLERMGPRGSAAFDSLVLALDDPHGAVSGAPAESLVAVSRGTPKAENARDVLTDRLDEGCPHELKVACVRALGNLDPTLLPEEHLARTFEAAQFSDLKLAAATGLLKSGRADLALPWLITELAARGGDPAGAEAALEDWLRARAQGTPVGSPENIALDSWTSEAPKARVVHDSTQAKKRRAARAASLRSASIEPVAK